MYVLLCSFCLELFSTVFSPPCMEEIHSPLCILFNHTHIWVYPYQNIFKRVSFYIMAPVLKQLLAS